MINATRLDANKMNPIKERLDMKMRLSIIQSELKELDAKIEEHVIRYDRKLNRNDGSYSYELMQNLSDPIRKEQEAEARMAMAAQKRSLEETITDLEMQLKELAWLDEYSSASSFTDWIIKSGVDENVKVRNVTSGRTLMNLSEILKKRIVVKNPSERVVHVFVPKCDKVHIVHDVDDLVLYAVANSIVDLDHDPILLIKNTN